MSTRVASSVRRFTVGVVTLASGASFVLWVAATVLWTRSYRMTDFVSYGNNTDGAIGFMASRGSLVLCRTAAKRHGGRSLVREGFLHLSWHPFTIKAANLMNHWNIPTMEEEYLPSDPGLPRARMAVTYFDWAGFGYQVHWNRSRDERSHTTVRARMLLLPLWFVVLVTCVLPAHRLGRWLSRRRAKGRAAQNRCVACGYDLRATPSHCPECGKTSKEGD